MNEIGKVAIKLTLTGKKEVVSEAQSTGKEISSSIVNAITQNGGVLSIMQDTADAIYSGAKTAITQVSKIALGTAATALTTLTTLSVKNYGEYEQAVGGIETLYKDSADVMMEYAENAYKTAQISATDYMDQATKFGAALLQGLNGDTKKAAEMADLAIRDMADNANKMGTSIQSIQNAYQGFAKQNYSMLDNLRLGYGGTAGEMARLINDTKVLGEEIKVDAKTVKEVPFDKIIEAIHKVQEEIGFTGTSSAEALGTLQGSIKMTQAAWQNLLTGLADPKADLAKLTTNLVEAATTTASNLIPTIGRVMENLVPMLKQIGDSLVQGLLDVFQNLAPTLLAQILQLATALMDNVAAFIAGSDELLDSMLTAFASNIDAFFSSAVNLIATAVPKLMKYLPKVLKRLFYSFSTAISELIEGTLLPNLEETATKVIPQLINDIVPVIVQQLNVMKDTFIAVAKTLPEALPAILDGAMALAEAFLSAIPEVLPVFIQAVSEIVSQIAERLPAIVEMLANAIMTIVEVLVQPENLTAIITAGVQLFTALIECIPTILNSLLEALPNIIDAILQFFLDSKNQELIANAFLQCLMALITVIPRILGILFENFKILFSTLWERLQTTFGDFAYNFAVAIGQKVLDAFNAVVGFIEKQINFVLRGINGFIGLINNIISAVGGHLDTIPMLSLPRLAEGGLATSATPALIGEAGKEAVIPLERNQDNWAGLLASKLAEEFESQDYGSQRPITIVMNNTINNDMDTDEMCNKLTTALRRAV